MREYLRITLLGNINVSSTEILKLKVISEIDAGGRESNDCMWLLQND
jgi:hypothetical protein